MKGYSSLRQYTSDHKLLCAARNLHGPLAYLISRRIRLRLENATRQFRTMLKKHCYTKTDLSIIAAHDNMRRIHGVDHFIRFCFGTNHATANHYRKLLTSSAFRRGRLTALYDFIPVRIRTKNEFIRFLRSRKGIPRAELPLIMSCLADNSWHGWLDELVESGLVNDCRGRWVL